ncbi:PREDICTED: uncharacterized protein LOC106146440, partial [Chinchilla lanigera]|uniref:uncharacterized protein LOC106146440 n=1 Tax=Chinchilla lanigera TaxID=34839 RepID=UPI00069707BA
GAGAGAGASCGRSRVSSRPRSESRSRSRGCARREVRGPRCAPAPGRRLRGGDRTVAPARRSAEPPRRPGTLGPNRRAGLGRRARGARRSSPKSLAARLSAAQVGLARLPSQEFWGRCLLEFGGVGSSCDGRERCGRQRALRLNPKVKLGHVAERAFPAFGRPRPARKIPEARRRVSDVQTRALLLQGQHPHLSPPPSPHACPW